MMNTDSSVPLTNTQNCCFCSIMSGKELSAAVGIALAILAIGVGGGITVHELLHWGERTATLLGGGIALTGLILEVALFVLYKKSRRSESSKDEIFENPKSGQVVLHKKSGRSESSKDDVSKKPRSGQALYRPSKTIVSEGSKKITVEKLNSDGSQGSRRIFRVQGENNKTYYVKSPQKGYYEKDFIYEKRPIKDWLAYEMSIFIGTACIPKTWYFKNKEEFKKSLEFSKEFKEALESNEDFKENVRQQPIIIQEGVDCLKPEQVKNLDKNTAHETFLSILFMNNWDATNSGNCVVDKTGKVYVIDNDTYGRRIRSLKLFTEMWLYEDKVMDEQFDDMVKEKFLKVNGERLIERLKCAYKKHDLALDHKFLQEVLENLKDLKTALLRANTPREMIQNFENRIINPQQASH